MSLTNEQQILVEQRLSNERKSVGVTYLIWFLVGWLGVHRFYLGRTGSAFCILILTILSWLFLAFGVGLVLLMIVGVWLLVDIFLIPGMVESHTRERRMAIANEIGLLSASTPPAIR